MNKKIITSSKEEGVRFIKLYTDKGAEVFVSTSSPIYRISRLDLGVHHPDSPKSSPEDFHDIPKIDKKSSARTNLKSSKKKSKEKKMQNSYVVNGQKFVSENDGNMHPMEKKRGRPKGSKNIKKSVETEEIEDLIIDPESNENEEALNSTSQEELNSSSDQHIWVEG